ncbi:M48 family metalloprotease [Armatimonas rosea]|uniref:Putative Zn-dependent protease n=1 Tax=Armatimonas rosea TaxID=685828 RepID=A0A7W9SVY0_ARMRO|nr:M48 family metalloprotease [Armatimonas rosea]MBB6053378.1 putative Zn-dependent protease [Armatimonas rosea]
MRRTAALLATAFCLALPALTPRALPQDKKPAAAPLEDPEVKLGRESHEEMIKSGLKLVTDPALVKRVETMGQKLAAIINQTPIPALYGSENKISRPFVYRFFIVDDPDTNAFALPGGYVYVNKGLLKYAQSDDELAGVVGHEIIHAAHSHGAKLQREQSKLNTQMAIAALGAILGKVPLQDTGNLLTGFQLLAIQKVNGYGQTAERDADQGGIILAQKAGYNPVGMLTFMERLARDQRSHPDVELGIFRTHPPEKVRAEAMIAQITQMGLPINRRATADILKVATRADGTLTEVLLDGKVFLRTPKPERAKEVAAALDKALDQDLQVYDVRKQGTSIQIRGQHLVTLETSDGAAPVDKLADDACKMLRLSLYRYVLNGTL